MNGYSRSGFLALSLVLLLCGCEILGLDEDVEVRVRNGSSLTLDEATVFLFDGALTVTDFQPGAVSEYRVVDKAYDYTSALVVVGADSASLQVIDYVGETPLDGGRYTYVLRVFAESPLSIGMDFEKDS